MSLRMTTRVDNNGQFFSWVDSTNIHGYRNPLGPLGYPRGFLIPLFVVLSTQEKNWPLLSTLVVILCEIGKNDLLRKILTSFTSLRPNRPVSQKAASRIF